MINVLLLVELLHKFPYVDILFVFDALIKLFDCGLCICNVHHVFYFLLRKGLTLGFPKSVLGLPGIPHPFHYCTTGCVVASTIFSAIETCVGFSFWLHMAWLCSGFFPAYISYIGTRLTRLRIFPEIMFPLEPQFPFLAFLWIIWVPLQSYPASYHDYIFKSKRIQPFLFTVVINRSGHLPVNVSVSTRVRFKVQ